MPAPARPLVVAVLGIAQILAWGSTYYLLGVLAPAIAADTGWPLAFVVGALSGGLIAGGLASPSIGRAIQRHGGRPVLAAGAVLIAAGQAGLAASLHPAMYLAAWIVLGIGMAAGLYDAVFAALGRFYGDTARGAITAVTLWGGFASTACWPLSAFLVAHLGWRGACLVYAALQLCVSLPAFFCLLPRSAALSRPALLRPAEDGTDHGGRTFVVLGLTLTVAGSIASMIAVHLLTLLRARGLDLGAAVALGALFGPAQVGARLVEMAVGRRYHPLWTMRVSSVLIAAGLVLLASGVPVPGVALVLYGCGNGLWSIVRGTVPLALFGAARYPVLMGRLAMPALLAAALAPALGALLIERAGAGVTAWVLAGLGALNMLLAWRLAADGPAR